MLEAATEKPPLTWQRSALIVLIVIGIGTLLAEWEPIWLSPPHFASTDYLYMIPALAWIPGLIILRLRRPIGWRWTPILLVVVGLVPTVGAIGLAVRAGVLTAVEPVCVQQPLTDGQIVQTCRLSMPADNAIDFTFEGSPGAVFVRRLDTSICQGQACKPLKP